MWYEDTNGFIREDGFSRAGKHVLLDLWSAKNLTDTGYIRETLKEAAEATGATILNDYFYSFGNDGCTGVVFLAESHISIHTWPERDYAAIDIFTCGRCDPKKSIPVLKKAFETNNLYVQELTRGLTDENY